MMPGQKEMREKGGSGERKVKAERSGGRMEVKEGVREKWKNRRGQRVETLVLDELD